MAELRCEHYGLQELWSVHVMLGISQLLALPEVEGLEGIYRLGHHVVRRFDTLGVVVGFEIKANKNNSFRANIVLDDGSGVIHCVRWSSSDAGADSELRDIPLGSLLRVRGRMNTFRGKRQLTAFQSNSEHDPLAEPLRWLELERLWRDVYSKDPRPAIAALTNAAASGARLGGDIAAVRGAIEAIFCAPETNLQDADPNSVAHSARRAFAYASLLDPSGQVYAAALRSVEVGAPRESARGDAGLGNSDDGDVERQLHAAAKRLVQHALRGLMNDGRIELIDAVADVYAPFDPEAQLLPAIQNHFIRAAQRADGDGALTLARLHELLADQEGRAFTVSKATLRTAIDTLLDQSLIYDVGTADTFRAIL